MSDGKQRYQCKVCNRSFSWSSNRCKYQREFEWFQRWITEGYSIRQLAIHSGHSQTTIKRIIRYWLMRPPVDRPISESLASIYFVLDGTYLHHRYGLFAAIDGVDHRLIYGAYGIREGPSGLTEYCRRLHTAGCKPKTATIDGNPHLFRALVTAWPEIIIQRCLIHIQRQGLS
jgi:hypothetical protein